MHADLEQDFTQRKAAAINEVAHWRRLQSRYQLALLPLILVIFLFARGSDLRVGLLVAGTVAALIVTDIALMLRARDHAGQTQRRVDYYAAAIARIRGESTQTGFTGEAFTEEDHIYSRDLNILGEDSLFGMLATTRTALGQRALAHMLLHPVDAPSANARQAAVQELAALTDLREHVGLLGRYGFEDLPAESFETWLAATRNHFATWLRVVLLVLTLLWIAGLVTGLCRHWESQQIFLNVVPVFAAQALFCWRVRPQVLKELDAAKLLASQTIILRDGIAELRRHSFTSPLLRSLQQQAEGEDRALKQLQRHLDIVEQRTKEWFYVLSLTLCLGTHTSILLDRWKQKHGAAMRHWLDAWAHFDALVAVASYAAEHAANTYPNIIESGSNALFDAKALKHPLLPRDRAVANDITLDASTQFLLISGSNMAGKSTLLRAIGTNVVLAHIGAPVTAGSLTLSALTIGASIAIVDSLAEGKSKFLAEVERLKSMVELAQSHPGCALFLIDEVLSGTNSADRKFAAESVLRSLIATGAVGAMSTHDLTLASLAELASLHGRNVHMASPAEDDPLAFDYLLKDGINRTTNAMAIVRMLGLAEPLDGQP